MQIVAIVAGVVVVATWLTIVFGRGGFWRVRSAVLRNGAEHRRVRVAAVVPARNEADVIARSVVSLLTQELNGPLHVFLVDDHSEDRTAEVARRAAEEVGRGNALTVLRGAALPAGWTGKLWAVAQGVEAAKALAPNYLLLTDADVVHGPDTVARLVVKSECEQFALTSLMVRLHCVSVAERMLVPAFVYFFFLLYPPKWIADRSARTAGAAGGCMLVRPEALERAGGIAAIRDEIIDDCALAKSIKRSGGSVWLGLAQASASVRPYTNFREIGRMIERTAFNQLRHSTLLLGATVVGLLITYILPIALLFSNSTLAVALGGTAVTLMVGSYLPMVRYYGLSPLWALTLPGSAYFYLWSTLRSAWSYWLGRGGQWKGRAQDRKSAVAK